MDILVIDVGGNNIKLLASGEETVRKVKSGRDLTPQRLIDGVLKATADWRFDMVSIGVPAAVSNGQVRLEPANLGRGWIGFDFAAALGKPVKLINDAAMQALGSFEGGRMLFLGLGTGLGTALVVDDVVVDLELGHLPYRKRRTYEQYLGIAGLKKLGKGRWRRIVHNVTGRLKAAFIADYVVLGGGNSKKLAELPPDCRLGSNANAFVGGFRMWGAE
jgi:polyphosphate glucokinase